MYKCSECGNEYDVMPKFCECGNDIFITVDDYVPQEVEDIEDEMPKSRSRNLRRTTFSPVSVAGFVCCIVLSLLILFVIGNPPKKDNDSALKNSQNEKIEIPSIETFWDNTPPKIAVKAQPKEENIIDKIVEQIVPQPVKEAEDSAGMKISASTQKKLSPVAPNKIQADSAPKVVQPQKQTASKPVAKTQPQTQNKVQTNQQSGMTFEDLTNKIRNQYYANQNTNSAQNTGTQKVQSSASVPAKQTQIVNKTMVKQQITNSQLQVTPQSVTVSVPSKTTPAAAQTVSQIENVKSDAQLKRELASYKSGLRNTIGKKIDFTRVIGDGECSLVFKIDSNGRLISKAFSKQSSNITLNDAAFNALNTTISYNPPPDGYKGEILTFSIKFYNGNFEITLN